MSNRQPYKNEELIVRKVVQLTVPPHKDEDFETLIVRPYVIETVEVCSDIVNAMFMREIHTDPAV